MSSAPPAQLGKYQIIREIARSNDIVYEGYDPVLNRRVAVKELAIPSGANSQEREERIKRFLREARAAGTLDHPNIMTVYDAGQSDDHYFIAMEFLDGKTLRQEMDAVGPLQEARCLEIVRAVLEALEYSHSRGVIHRDVKPENIQLLSSGAIKLTDFGIARLTFEPNLTMDGQVFGTPSYMSPEQVQGKEIDCRSDIFSVGVLLYEMLTGQKPFRGDSVVAITYAITSYSAQWQPMISARLWEAIYKALSKDPKDRFSNAEEFGTALRLREPMTIDAPPVKVAPPPPAKPAVRQISQPSATRPPSRSIPPAPPRWRTPGFQPKPVSQDTQWSVAFFLFLGVLGVIVVISEMVGNRNRVANGFDYPPSDPPPIGTNRAAALETKIKDYTPSTDGQWRPLFLGLNGPQVTMPPYPVLARKSFGTVKADFYFASQFGDIFSAGTVIDFHPTGDLERLKLIANQLAMGSGTPTEQTAIIKSPAGVAAKATFMSGATLGRIEVFESKDRVVFFEYTSPSNSLDGKNAKHFFDSISLGQDAVTSKSPRKNKAVPVGNPNSDRKKKRSAHVNRLTRSVKF